jgi:hypothetical protein
MSRGVLRTTRRLSVATVTAAVGVLGFLPSAQAEVRVGQNARMSSDSSPFRGKDQVALAVDPNNAQHIVEVNEEILTQRCEGTASFDGGATWSEAVSLPLPAASGADLPFDQVCRMAQTLEFGSGQNVYATSIAARVSPTGNQAASLLVYKSTDGGKTWGAGVVAMAGGVSTTGPTTNGPNLTRPALTVEPGAGPGAPDRVYAIGRETTGFENSGPPCPEAAPTTPPAAPAVTRCASVRSTVSNDGGQTFAPAVRVSPAGVNVTEPTQPVIGTGGAVSVGWRTVGNTGSIQVARSTDRGATWGAAVSTTPVFSGGRTGSSHVTPQPFSGSSYPRLAVNKQNGNLYLVFGQGTPLPDGFRGADHFIAPDSRVYFQRSTDNGATWSDPKVINDPTPRPGTPTVQTRHPDVEVAPNGRVDIVWEDRRHWYQGPGERNCVHTHIFCDDPRLGDAYYAYSSNSGDTFTSRRISDQSHNNDVGYDYRNGVYWDYGPQSVAIGDDKVLIGWMDAREGSFDTDTQDIYLAKVDFNAPSAVPQSAVEKPDVVSRSVALSNLANPGGGDGALISVFATRNTSKVVIVNQDDAAGALAGGVLARANLGPVLLSPPSGLPASVKAEVARLNPTGAYIVGDAAKLSNQVSADLVGVGVEQSQITRISGPDDASTAALAAAQFDRRAAAEKDAGSPAFDAAVIANSGSVHSGAAAGLAAARRLPILYVSANAVPSATSAALSSLKINKTLVIGGTQQVSDAVMGQLPSATRLGGADQYATSKAVIAESKSRGLPSNVVYVADGTKPMDAALLGPTVGRTTGMLLLSPPSVDATAASTAASSGLSGIDKLVLVKKPAAVGPDGPISPGVRVPDKPGPTQGTNAPSLSSVSLTRRVFAVGSKPTATAAAARKKRTPIGTAFRFTLSKPAKVSIVIAKRGSGRRSGKKCARPTPSLRKRRKCILITKSGTLSRSGKQGKSSVAFTGRIGRRALKAGSYQATLRATDTAGRHSKSVVVTFRVVR